MFWPIHSVFTGMVFGKLYCLRNGKEAFCIPEWLVETAFFVGYCIALAWLEKGLLCYYLMTGYFSLLIYYCVFPSNGIIKRILETKPLTYLGDLSLEFYLLHLPVMNTTETLLGHFGCGGHGSLPRLCPRFWYA